METKEITSFQHKSFIRRHHVIIDRINRKTDKEEKDNRYGLTVDAASMVERDAALNSARTADLSDTVDIFGNRSSAHPAHLLPYSTNCASYWTPIVRCVLSFQKTEAHSWDFVQKCIHGTECTEAEASNKKLIYGSTEMSDSVSTLAGKSYKMHSVGIKHFPTNRIRLFAQKDYYVRSPCVIIVPLLTLEEVNKWNGEAYEAIVLAGAWNKTDAAQVYLGINATRDMMKQDGAANRLADKDQCETACHLLDQMIRCICEAVNDSTASRFYNDKFEKRVDTVPIKKINVPVSDWKDSFKVRKISFANSNEQIKPAPDPVLLLAKAASNWFKRQDNKILPGWCSDDDTTYADDDGTEETETGIAEVDINRDIVRVDEPLSDDEYMY